VKRALLVLPLLALACQGPGQSEVLLTPPDVSGYVNHVHEYIEARCATLDCHGGNRRPLRIFAETGLRASDALRGQPLTEAESSANAWSMVGIDPAAPSVEDHLLLLAPLATAEGGQFHVGGDIFSSRDDPAYRCLAAWLRHDVAAPEASADCASATAAVALPPAPLR